MSLILLGILNSQAAAAGGAAAYDLLETQTLGTAAASVTFTGLGSYTDYKHLQLRSTHLSTNASGASLEIQFNGDSTTYRAHYLKGDGTSVTSADEGSGANIRFSNIIQRPNVTNAFGPSIIDILDFSNTNKNTTLRAMIGDTDLAPQIFLGSGLYIGTAAITSIRLQVSTANFEVASRFSLYGVR